MKTSQQREMDIDVNSVDTTLPASEMIYAVSQFFKWSAMIDPEKRGSLVTSLYIDISTIIRRLIKSEKLDQCSCFVLTLYTRGFTINDIAAIFNCQRDTILAELNNICQLVATELGDDYFEE